MIKLVLFFALCFNILIASAATVVPVVWPFDPSASNAMMIRAMLNTANSQQNKYEFVFFNKPGAGGTIAAIAVAQASELTVLATSSSFYIRSKLFKESHNIDDFKLVTDMCGQQPLAIYSKKYKTIRSMKYTQLPITIGLIPGSITNLITKTIEKNNTNIKFTEVYYKGTPEATTHVIADILEASVDFTGPSVLSRLPNDVAVVGITGDRSIRGFSTFQSENVKGLERLVMDHYFLVSKSVNDNTRKELNEIFNNAFVNVQAKEICDADNGVLKKMPFDRVDSFNKESNELWSKFTEGFEKQ